MAAHGGSLWLLLAAIVLPFTATKGNPLPGKETYALNPKLVAEIKSYKDVAAQIIDFSLNGPGQNQSYDRLATFTDSFGSRLSGTQNLEDAIDSMLNTLKADKLDNVHGEVVNVSRWVRGKEYAILHTTKEWNLAISGLGKSIGTDGKELTAAAIVVTSFDDLESKSSEVAGKIVVYNQDFVSYADTASYRVLGAATAAKYGAVATLIRSVTPQSIYSPHTGIQEYADGVKKIPTACITVEDAEMMERMQARGWPLMISLYMEAQNFDPSPSRNTVAEVQGAEYPEQVVLVSGHMDSWDVGRGAMDDGGGAFISWQALSIIRQMGLKPRRTMRLVMWTDEEAGGVGSKQYYEAHKSDAGNFSILFESDMGVFMPYGIRFTGSPQAKAIMAEIGKLLVTINSTAIYGNGGETDNGWWADQGVPLGSLANHNEKYFWYHHSNGDTMTVLDPDEMNRCSAVFAVYAYVLADIETMLPRK
jgi:carboxypeptidase Q